jgi:hypothetical protein
MDVFLINRIYIGVFIFLFSCGNGDKILPRSTGKEGELLLIVDEKYWKHPVGDTLKAFFSQDMPGLPQSEPMFKVYKIFPKDFTLSFKTNKNILIINIDPNHPVHDPILEIGYDNWAKDQLVLKLSCNNPDEFFEAFRIKRKRITQLFIDKDLERYQRKYAMASSKAIQDKLKEKFGIKMSVPEGFFVNREEPDFIYLTHEAMKKVGSLQHQITRGIWIYTFPYTDKQTFTKKYVTQIRDSITRLYIQGAADSSYMAIEYMYPPDSASTTIQKEYALETRGLWRMENYFMGGPFLNYITYDERKKRIIMVDGFVFAPRFDKREYMLQMEAILKSLTIL